MATNLTKVDYFLQHGPKFSAADARETMLCSKEQLNAYVSIIDAIKARAALGCANYICASMPHPIQLALESQGYAIEVSLLSKLITISWKEKEKSNQV